MKCYDFILNKNVITVIRVRRLYDGSCVYRRSSICVYNKKCVIECSYKVCLFVFNVNDVVFFVWCDYIFCFGFKLRRNE